LTIRTRYNNQSWDIKNSGKTKDMQIWSTNSGWFQIFFYNPKDKGHFCNFSNKDMCIEVTDGRNKDYEGQPVRINNHLMGAW
jgi:hypothetical protein